MSTQVPELEALGNSSLDGRRREKSLCGLWEGAGLVSHILEDVAALVLNGLRDQGIVKSLDAAHPVGMV